MLKSLAVFCLSVASGLFFHVFTHTAQKCYTGTRLVGSKVLIWDEVSVHDTVIRVKMILGPNVAMVTLLRATFCIGKKKKKVWPLQYFKTRWLEKHTLELWEIVSSSHNEPVCHAAECEHQTHSLHLSKQTFF